jgi:hypothetical protein
LASNFEIVTKDGLLQLKAGIETISYSDYQSSITADCTIDQFELVKNLVKVNGVVTSYTANDISALSISSGGDISILLDDALVTDLFVRVGVTTTYTDNTIQNSIYIPLKVNITLNCSYQSVTLPFPTLDIAVPITATFVQDTLTYFASTNQTVCPITTYSLVKKHKKISLSGSKITVLNTEE